MAGLVDSVSGRNSFGLMECFKQQPLIKKIIQISLLIIAVAGAILLGTVSLGVMFYPVVVITALAVISLLVYSIISCRSQRKEDVSVNRQSLSLQRPSQQPSPGNVAPQDPASVPIDREEQLSQQCAALQAEIRELQQQRAKEDRESVERRRIETEQIQRLEHQELMRIALASAHAH